MDTNDWRLIGLTINILMLLYYQKLFYDLIKSLASFHPFVSQAKKAGRIAIMMSIMVIAIVMNIVSLVYSLITG